MKKTVIIAANVTYSNVTFNTRLTVEYKHSGEQYWIIKRGGIQHILSGEDSAREKVREGKKVYYSPGYYFAARYAIPTIMANGQPGTWYINNEDDYYRINRISKYAKKLNEELSRRPEQIYKPAKTSQL